MTVTASNYERAANEFYQTEHWVTRAALKHFPVNGRLVLDPCAGNHMMADILAEQARAVATADLHTYDREHDFPDMDFLDESDPRLFTHYDAIFANPPYGKGNRLAVRFCELALKRCNGLVAMLLTAKFDSGSTRSHLFRDNPRFAAKITLTDRISWTLDGVTGTEDHSWFIWTETPVLPRLPRIIYEGRPRATKR